MKPDPYHEHEDRLLVEEHELHPERFRTVTLTDTMKTKVELTDAELLMLDGSASEELQKVIDAVKMRQTLPADSLTEKQKELVVKIVNHAKDKGRLRYTAKQLTSCQACFKSAGYAKFKSGPRKGMNNFDKPLSFYGMDLSPSSVSVRGYASLGCCHECWNSIKPVLAKQLESVQAELPEQVMGVPPLYKYYPMRHCKKCGWTGSERLMTKKRTMMGDGWYPAGCPSCGAENIFLGPTLVGNAEGFEIHETLKP